ncbi:hypothetical protein [Paenisporosarcina indica]|uniref:hypothetical protein n=1 Tax=Paenisporosarcina indica TaxID=650093 RepID=UPI0009501D53|nr:hypothetical protein [Paenisporosarcina indica]
MKRNLLILIGLVGIILYLTGCNKVVSAPKLEVKQVLDVTQFSKMPQNELLAKLGEPLRKDEWVAKSRTGKEYPATSYHFEIDHVPIEFISIEHSIVGMNVLNLEHDDYKLKIEQHKDILPLIGISPSKDMKVSVENSVTARYSSINDKVDDVWATLNNKTVDFLRVTFDSSYFDE